MNNLKSETKMSQADTLASLHLQINTGTGNVNSTLFWLKLHYFDWFF